tara:strand:+ start:775 stop:1662 length:888 start_codon:yes stop_codon:yes gene_type:complete
VGSDKEASKAFQEALLHARENIESKQNSIDNVERDSDRPVELTENIPSDETSSSKLTASSNIERGDSFPSSALFLIGLLLPIITGIIISSIVFQSSRTSSTFHQPVYTPENEQPIVLNNETYMAYEVTMTGGFSDDYPPDCHQNCWEFFVEVRTDLGFVGKAIYGYSVGPSLNSFDPVIENGDVWYLMDLRNCEGYVPEFDCDDEIYIKINTDGTVNIATNYGIPTFMEYVSVGSWDYDMDPHLQNLGLGMWPILMIAGIIWAYKTDRKPFAYGIITAGVLFITIPFVLFSLVPY